ncbi:MAG: S9 family peptidase, partial [Thermoanaerobaculia bacterium]|nr:S9 family peptidase [Thermoanaerobaculia bacterium]
MPPAYRLGALPWTVLCCWLAAGAALAGEATGDGPSRVRPLDVFELEWASDPQLSPDGQQIAYVRDFFDIRSDARRSNIWLIDADGGGHRPLTSGSDRNTSPRWSPSGDRLLWVSSEDGSAQLHMHWLETGATARITNLTRSPGSLAWSPDGRWIALTMRIPKTREPLASMPPKPEGAEWAEPPRVIETLVYRADGAGFLEEGYTHLFVVPADGGTPRQL